MTDLSSLSSTSTSAATGMTTAHKHAHHAKTGQFQNLMSSLGAGPTSSTATTGAGATQTGTTAAASGTASTASVSGTLGGLQHVLDLLQGVSA